MEHFCYIYEIEDKSNPEEQETSYDHRDSQKVSNPETEQDPFLCWHCNACFSNERDLESHLEIHANENLVDDDEQRHDVRIHDNQPQPKYGEKFQYDFPQPIHNRASPHQTQVTEEMTKEIEGKQAENFMLDITSNISENRSFYIDGNIVSSTLDCEVEESPTGSSNFVVLDTLSVNLDQTDQVLSTEKELPVQGKRRTTTPPLLPQTKPELESEVVVSLASPSVVSSQAETSFPQSVESTAVQKGKTVFLSPKLKELLEKQEGLKPRLALITDGLKPSSPVSLSVLPSGAAKFKRRTCSPQQFPATKDETSENDVGGLSAGSSAEMEQRHSSPVQEIFSQNSDVASLVEVTESWPPATGGNSCNQKPLDLSNTLKGNEDVVSSALDLSLQKRFPADSVSVSNLDSPAGLKRDSNACVAGNSDTPVVTDLAILSGANVCPLENVAEQLLYGLALPSSTVSQSVASLNSVALDPTAPCSFAFASPVAHTVLPTPASVITVLAPPLCVTSPSSQPIQVLAPTISSEPLVLCAENALSTSECDLTALNLPGQLFLTDQIGLNPPLVDSTPVSELPLHPTVTLNDSLLNIAGNTVLIECRIALEAPMSVPNAAGPLTPSRGTVDHMKQQQIVTLPTPQSVDHPILVTAIAESTNTEAVSDSQTEDGSSADPGSACTEKPTQNDKQVSDMHVSVDEMPPKNCPHTGDAAQEGSDNISVAPQQQTFTKNFICNVCDKVFHSIKELSSHIADHADEWPYKCEFCVLLFGKPSALLDHRSSLHGVGKTYVCSLCTKEFVYLCNLKQHQEELHPGQQCSYTEDEKGKLRPQNYNNSSKVNTDSTAPKSPEEPKAMVKTERCEVDIANDQLFTTIKIMSSGGRKVKGPDVRLGINQHYPSFKPPPFPYHNRSPAGSLASATNFTTHNIPQTFSTAIRCTKCGKGFDNMPELHKHILACANASDKRRYTPRKNPIPLRHFAKTENGVLSSTNSANGLNTSLRVEHANKSRLSQEPPVKIKLLRKRKNSLVQRVRPQRNKMVSSANKVSCEGVENFVCPHCSREFTMRRSRTKHMAVCTKKPKEIKKRKDGGISVTKENDGHLHRGVARVKPDKRYSPPQHNTRLQTSGSAKRSAVLPAQTVFTSKRSKIIIKESTQMKQESPTLTEVPIRTFNPSMRQYSRVPHSIKGVPIKITIVKPQHVVQQKEESGSSRSPEEATGTNTGHSDSKSAL